MHCGLTTVNWPYILEEKGLEWRWTLGTGTLEFMLLWNVLLCAITISLSCFIFLKP